MWNYARARNERYAVNASIASSSDPQCTAARLPAKSPIAWKNEENESPSEASGTPGTRHTVRGRVPPGMDRATASELAHGDLALHNPLSLGRLDEVIALLDLPPHARVLDVGCGAGEALARVCERWDAAGTGVDAHEPLVTRARRRAPELDFHAADARTFPYDRGGYDVAMTIGSSHAFGGDFRYALGRLAELARPGGQVLLGEGYWRRPPDAAYLAV